LKKSCLLAIGLSLMAPAWAANPPSDQEEPPFKPHWTNEISAGSTNQQGGQATQLFGYSGTYLFNEAGDFLSAGLNGTRQKIEGTFSKTAGLNVTGGLGWGAWCPTLSLGAAAGDSAMRQLNAAIGMGFLASDNLSLSLSLGANAGNHQGDVTGYLQGIFANNPVLLALVNNSAPVTGQIDTAGVDASLSASYVLTDGWTLSLSLGFAYDQTYQIEDLKNDSLTAKVNDADQTITATLGSDFTLFKGFDLDLEPQIGREYQPAGTVYSHQTGGLVQNTQAATQNFVGGTVTVSYRFD
jgi:hypothetical protein